MGSQTPEKSQETGKAEEFRQGTNHIEPVTLTNGVSTEIHARVG